MSQVVSISTRKVYGLSRVCRIWRRCRSSVYWHRAQNNEAKEPRRRGPQGPCSDVELIQKIREVLQQSPFHGEGYRKVWAKLRYKGIRNLAPAGPAVDAPGKVCWPSRGWATPGGRRLTRERSSKKSRIRCGGRT